MTDTLRPAGVKASRVRVSVQHHDLLWPAPVHSMRPGEIVAGLPPEAHVLYHAVVEATQPRTAVELAIRLQLPFAVVAVVVTELIEAGLVRRTHTAARPSDEVTQRVMRGLNPVVPETVKIVVAGAPGSGKSTFIGTLSDPAPARYDELLPSVPKQGQDRAWHVVVRDVGWMTVPDGLVLTMVSHPGRPGCDGMWDDVARNAAGAIVLVDPEHVIEAAPQVTALEQRRVPFVLALNPLTSMTAAVPNVETVRGLLDLAADIPVATVDPRVRAQARKVTTDLFDYVGTTRATVPVSTNLSASHHSHGHQEAEQ